MLAGFWRGWKSRMLTQRVEHPQHLPAVVFPAHAAGQARRAALLAVFGFLDSGS